MKSLTITFSLFAALFVSCADQSSNNDTKASSKDRGTKQGEGLCNCLGEINSLNSREAMQSRMDSCENSLQPEWDLSEKDYKSDSVQWTQFQEAYKQAIQSKMDAYNEKMKSYAAEVAQAIREGIQHGYWIKKGDDKAEHVCTFTDGQLKFINSSGKTNFTIQSDTLIFDDKGNTKATVRLNRNGQFILTSCENGKEGVFEKASDKDKIVGQWSVKGGLSAIFYANGTCTVAQGYNARTSNYTLRGNDLEIDGPPAYSISLSNPDRFGWGQASFSRVKGSYPKSLNILF